MCTHGKTNRMSGGVEQAETWTQGTPGTVGTCVHARPQRDKDAGTSRHTGHECARTATETLRIMLTSREKWEVAHTLDPAVLSGEIQ